MYIGDCEHHRMRKVVMSTSIISTIAGTGTASYSGDNIQASSATLDNPIGVAVDTSGKSSLKSYISQCTYRARTLPS